MSRPPTPEERAALDSTIETARECRDAVDAAARAWEAMITALEDGDGAAIMVAQVELNRAAVRVTRANTADMITRTVADRACVALFLAHCEAHGVSPGRVTAAIRHSTKCDDPQCHEAPEVEAVVALLRAGPH